MNINYDIFQNKKLIERITTEVKIVIVEMHKLIEQRLQPLKEEIEMEEKEKGDLPEIMVYLITYEDKTRFHFKGYSDELIEKMNKSFLPADIELLNQKLDRIIHGMNN